MKARHLLLGIAAGVGAGYVAARAWESTQLLAGGIKPRTQDAAAYGALRRALSVSGIARTLAESAALAYGPLGDWAQRSVRTFPQWLQPAAFAFQLGLLDAVIELPVAYVEDYAMEHRFGLSEQTAASWLSDQLKQTAIGTAVTAALAALLGSALRRFPTSWPYLASAATFPLVLLANIVVPLYVMPLFNTYEPLEGPLEERLRALARRYGVGDAEILRMNMSKQTKKANAFVIGIGQMHRIVVGDTLIEHFSPEEIEFVVAHELGHYVSKDTWRMIALAQMSATALIFGAYWAVPRQARDDEAQARDDDDVLQLARIHFWASLLSQALRPAISAFARSREWAADRFALEATKQPATGASAFRRLRDQNLAEDEQPAWYEFLFSTHPSLKARIAALEAAN